MGHVLQGFVRVLLVCSMISYELVKLVAKRLARLLRGLAILSFLQRSTALGRSRVLLSASRHLHREIANLDLRVVQRVNLQVPFVFRISFSPLRPAWLSQRLTSGLSVELKYSSGRGVHRLLLQQRLLEVPLVEQHARVALYLLVIIVLSQVLGRT